MGPLRKNKKKPEQFEGGGEKERVAGGENCAERRTRLMLRLRGTKKRVPGGGGWSPARALCYC